MARVFRNELVAWKAAQEAAMESYLAAIQARGVGRASLRCGEEYGLFALRRE